VVRFKQALRLKVSPTTSMSPSRCMDAMIDWDKGGLAHYDSRVVRSCLPGMSEETDPGGDLYWDETDPIFISNVLATRMGWGYVVSASNLSVVGWERFANTGSGSGSLDAYAPGTGTQGYARVRTRYNNGSVLSCNPLPVTSFAGSGGCS